MNIILQGTGGYAYPLNGEIERPNNILGNITRNLLMKSIHKKEILYFSYQYTISISFRIENRLRGDVPYFLWNG